MSLSLECKRTVTTLSSQQAARYDGLQLTLWDGDGLVNVADYLRRQFFYDGWANREVLKAIRAVGDEDKRSLQLMAHILAAGRVWLERLKQVPQSVPVWPQSDLAGCETEAKTD